MANTLLTPQMITREALRVLHQKLNFIGTINRQYDDQFAKVGAKIGSSLKVRLPNQYVVRSGATLSTQDTTETYVNLPVTTQKGVDLNFTSVDLTLSLDDFSKRILEPAMAVLAANVEYDVISNVVLPNVYNSVWNMGSANTLQQVLSGRKQLQDNLAPLNGRVANLNTQDNVDLINNVKGLFNDQVTLSRQYKEGEVGRTAGFDFYENTLWPAFTRGAGNTAYTTNTSTVSSGSASITVATGTGAMNVGDVFTIAGVYRVHPETKVSTGALQQFVVASAYAGGAGSVSIAPSIITTGATQNVTIPSGSSTAAITFAGTASTTTGTSLLYQEDAFTFASADLIMPKGVDFSAREVMDGLSMRIVRNYDIVNDKFPCRLDILYGYAALRPQLATRLHNN